MPKKQMHKKEMREKDEFEQRIIDLARVTRVMAGGKRLRFRACMVIGDRKGNIGMGLAKGADVSLAISKAVTRARCNLISVPMVNNTIPHAYKAKFKSAEVLLKPAPEGTGVIAGGAVRQVLELSGIPNIVAKILGTNNKVTNVTAVIKALGEMKMQSGNRKRGDKSQKTQASADKSKEKSKK